MPFTQESPEWNASGTKPPQSKLDAGWQIGERPPSGWWNWTLSRTHASIRELQLNAIHADQKGAANGVATLGADGKVPASQLNISAPADASTTVKGIVMLEDSTSSTSTTKAATPNSVKQANDNANGRIPATQKGQANGVATLGEDGKVPASQLNVSAPADATTATKGVVQLSNSTTSTSEVLAATPKAVKDAKDGLSTQIGILSGDLTTHTTNTSNPHSVTKAQVGLGSVENYAVATQAEAQAGTVTNKYMTPQRTKQAIDSQTGDRSTLNTTEKTTLVAAINELFTSVSNGKTQIATAITGKGVPASGGDTFPTLATKIGQISSGIPGEMVVKIQTPVTLSKGERVQYTSDIGAKLSNPSSLPAGGAYSSTYSPDGVYLVIGHATSPYITIYKRNGDTFTKLTNPTNLPAGEVNGVAFSPDGVYLAVAHVTSPYITIYKRNGDTFTKLSNPTSLPPSTSNCVTFSPDGTYLVVGHNATPYFTIYKRSGDTFTKLADPSVLPVVNVISASFSMSGEYLTVGYSGGSNVAFYKRAGDVFTKLTDPAVLPTGIVRGIAFSPDDVYLVLAHSTSPYITIYRRNGDIFTKLTNPSSLPPNGGNGVSFSPYGKLLAVAHASSPYVTFYKQSGDTFTKLTNPASLPTNDGKSVTFSPFDTHVTVTQFTSPYLSTYQMVGGLTQNDGISVADAMLGYTKTNASAGQTVDVAILFK